MKKLFSVFLSLVLVMNLSGCGQKEPEILESDNALDETELLEEDNGEISETAKWVSDKVDSFSDIAFDVSDKIWEYAELGFREKKSVEEYKKVLTENGFKFAMSVGGIETAFTASYGSGKPVIGLLAEYDAVDGVSQVAGSLKQEALVENGAGHGCGHNLLGAGCLSAALAIKAYLEENNKSGTVIMFGCPAEENGSGKVFMAREGAFKDVDIAYSWHPGDWTGVVPVSTLANEEVVYSFTGKAAHAASAPDMGRSALDAVELMNIGANYLREHVSSDVKFHYAVTDTGGTSANVVQAHAKSSYLIRAANIEAVKKVKERIDNIAKGAALMTGTDVDIKLIKASSHLVQNKVLGYDLEKAMNELGSIDFSDEDRKIADDFEATLDVKGIPASEQPVFNFALAENKGILENLKKSSLIDIITPYVQLSGALLGSTDVADVSLNCPTIMFMVTTCAVGTPGHSWQMVSQGKTSLAHNGMNFAAKAMTLSAIHFINNPKLVDEAWDEFNESMGGKTYECPIPKDISYLDVLNNF